jgi:rRNA-processing protein FCF1
VVAQLCNHAVRRDRDFFSALVPKHGAAIATFDDKLREAARAQGVLYELRGPQAAEGP